MTDLFHKPRLAPVEDAAAENLGPMRLLPPTDAVGRTDQLHAVDTGAAVSPAATVTPLGALLARHVIRDGEVVLLALKPSMWFILLSSLRFIGVVAILTLGLIAAERRYSREW